MPVAPNGAGGVAAGNGSAKAGSATYIAGRSLKHTREEVDAHSIGAALYERLRPVFDTPHFHRVDGWRGV